jgi:RNA polymerase sigma-70 factor, ECF subfamily
VPAEDGRRKATKVSASAEKGEDRWQERVRESAKVSCVEGLVLELSPSLIRTLTLIVLDREVAAEIAQETFVQLYLRWDDVAQHPNLPGWIYRVALNRAKDYRRSIARATRLIERIGRSLPSAPTTASWQPEAEFLDILRKLPKGQRTATALHHVGDLSVPEVARIMGTSEGTVKSHLHRAHLALKEMLEEDK